MVCISLRTVQIGLEACLLTTRFVGSPQSAQAGRKNSGEENVNCAVLLRLRYIVE